MLYNICFYTNASPGYACFVKFVPRVENRLNKKKNPLAICSLYSSLKMHKSVRTGFVY